MTDPYRTAAPSDKIDYEYYANASPDKIKKIHESIDLFDWKVCFICEGINNKEEKYFKTFECSKEPEIKYYSRHDRPGYDDGEFLFKTCMHFAMEKISFY